MDLESKIIEFPNAWNKNRPHKVRASTQNIIQLTENIFRFTEHNILPKNGLELDGHYKLYVNYKTFGWRVIQDSYWGSLTYTTEPKDKRILSKKDFTETTIKYIESLIADKLLGAYYWNWQNGKEHKKPLIKQCRSMITKPILELTETDKQIIKQLN